MTDPTEKTMKPTPMRLPCPECGQLHIDAGEFATKPHHTHSCQHCGLTWRPAVAPTVGVRFLPGFLDEQHAAGRGECERCGPEVCQKCGKTAPLLDCADDERWCADCAMRSVCAPIAAPPEPATGSRELEYPSAEAVWNDLPESIQIGLAKPSFIAGYNHAAVSEAIARQESAPIAEPPAPEAGETVDAWKIGVALLRRAVDTCPNHDKPALRAALKHVEEACKDADILERHLDSANQARDEFRKELDAALSQVEELKALREEERLILDKALIATRWEVDRAKEYLTAATSRAEAAEARAAKLEAELAKLIAQQACRENGPGGAAPLAEGTRVRICDLGPQNAEPGVLIYRAHGGSWYVRLDNGVSEYFEADEFAIEPPVATAEHVSDPPAPQEP